MPTYTLKDITNNHEWDVRCSWDDLQIMLDENPDIIRVWNTGKAPELISDSKSTLRRAGSGWNELLGRIQKGSGRGNTIKR